MIVCRAHPESIKKEFLLIYDYLFNKRKNYIKIFEDKFAEYTGARYALSISSARLALYSVCKALGLGAGDEVILPSYNCLIVPNILISRGIKPVFVDVNPFTYTIEPKDVKDKITKKTRAIIVTHIEGQPCEMGVLTKIAGRHKLYLIEDCAHAIGATYKSKKVGSFGDIGIFSFSSGKHINTLGGGMIVTNNKKIARAIRKEIRHYKKISKITLLKRICNSFFYDILSNKLFYKVFIFPFIYVCGIFYFDPIIYLFDDKKRIIKISDVGKIKYSQFQAMLGLSQLKDIGNKIIERWGVSSFFSNNLSKKIGQQEEIRKSRSSRLNFAVLLPDRKKMTRQLLMQGIDTQRTWMHSCSSLKMFNKYKTYCPVSDKLAKSVVYLPTHNISKKEAEYIIRTINRLK